MTEREQLARLSRAGPGAGYLAGAATVIALAASPPARSRRDRLHYDLGQATMSMMLTTAGLGISNDHTGSQPDTGPAGSAAAPDVLRLSHHIRLPGKPAAVLDPQTKAAPVNDVVQGSCPRRARPA